LQISGQTVNEEQVDKAEEPSKEEYDHFLEHKRGKKDIKVITDCPHVERKHYAKVKVA
jgi:hypothetical protein